MKKYIPILSLFLLSLAAISVGQIASAESRLDNRLPPGLAGLNLSAEQQNRVEAIMDERRNLRETMRAKTRQDLAAILTPEQMQRWEQFRQNRRQGLGRNQQRCVNQVSANQVSADKPSGGQPMNGAPQN